MSESLPTLIHPARTSCLEERFNKVLEAFHRLFAAYQQHSIALQLQNLLAATLVHPSFLVSTRNSQSTNAACWIIFFWEITGRLNENHMGIKNSFTIGSACQSRVQTLRQLAGPPNKVATECDVWEVATLTCMCQAEGPESEIWGGVGDAAQAVLNGVDCLVHQHIRHVKLLPGSRG